LTVPGLFGSGPSHWQSVWEERYGYTRVVQEDWERPDLDDWLLRLMAAVRSQATPPILVAHSLGCALVAHLARRAEPGSIAGALLVAPADVDDPAHTPEETRCFAPMPLTRFAFPSVLVASRDDPFLRFDRGAEFAKHWGARLVDAGSIGHINADSALGEWTFGQRLLEGLRRD
jgi:hypothetical protein